MAVTLNTDITSQMSKLASTFQTAIKATIDSESDPLTRIQTQKDTINVRKGVYTDMKTNLDALQSAVQALISTQATFGLSLTPKASVTATTAGTTVFTATNTDSAALGDYDIAVTKLAKAQSRAAEAAPTADLALGKSGVFWMGGTGLAEVSSFAASTSVTGAATGTVVTGKHELGQGAYSVQVRDYDGVRQFRLVNADGNAVNIQSTDGKSFTSGWQAMTNNSYDTGRGLVLTLNTSGAVGSTALTYTAKGTSINIGTNDTQRTIAASINAAVQPEGHDLRASIVGGKLIITGNQSGSNHAMIYTDYANLGFGSDLQSAQNAEFTVNGMSISRASNTNLTDVVEGATISLSGDAEGKSARLSIAGNSDKAATAINTFVAKYNAAYSHLAAKMATTTSTDASGKVTTARGPLAGDTVFRSLRIDLYNQLTQSYTNTGGLKNLTELGLSFDKDMKLSVDASKFTAALKSSSSDVNALLDAAMGKFNTTLSRHTGSTGTMQTSLTSMEGQIKSYDDRITKYTASLNLRAQTMINQYSQMQSQLSELGSQAQMFGISLTGTSSGSSINLFS